MDRLTHEVFGPILHVIRWKTRQLGQVVENINNFGYGLTLGLHTRLDSTIDLVRKLCKTGNLYVNRSQIGAVVESQPFGGEGLSGTGPKAGGPHYLARFVIERTLTVNTAGRRRQRDFAAQPEVIDAARILCYSLNKYLTNG